MRWLTKYLREIDGICRDGADTELSYRNAINTMLRAAAGENGGTTQFKILHEPRRRAGGAPDFRITNSGGAIVGYVECKAPGANLHDHAAGEQLNRYKALSPNILLTDGWRWLLLRDGGGVGDITLALPLATARRAEFIRQLNTFYAAAPQTIGDARQLARALAVRCALLRDELPAALKLGDSRHRLNHVYNEFKEKVYAEMSEDEFADAFAQTTTYCLFLAALRAPNTAQLSIYTVPQHIPQTFTLIRELSTFLNDLDTAPFSDLHWVLDDILALVKNMDAAAVAETMAPAQTTGVSDDDDLFLYFYETFLTEYDKQERKVRGVYYTPLPVVRFIVRAVDDLLKNDFGVADGLAGDGVNTLDFAAGTGTFMLEMMRLALNGKSQATQRLLVRDRLLNNFNGFELLIAPYVIAHLKLSQFLQQRGCGLDDTSQNKQLRLFLTDTLDITAPNAAKSAELPYLPALDEETRMADEVKRQTPILAIVGNPPYAGHSQNKGEEIKKLLRDYKYVHGENINERNPKWLQDDYVKFIRLAQHKMQQVERGVVAVITNHGFLDNPTFRGMRWNLMQTFNRLYFLDLHGNANKKETAPDGGADNNVFDIKQGVCISLLVKNPTLPHGVFHYDLFGTRQDKYNFCEANSIESVEWKELQPQKPFYLFIPQNTKAAMAYRQYPAVTDIFNLSSVGIVTARDKLTIGFDRDEIRRRAAIFAAMPTEKARARFNLGKDAEDWKIRLAQEDLNAGGLAEENLHPIAYRPFDTRYTYYTGNAGGFHCRPRKRIMKTMLAEKSENIGLVTVRQVAEEHFNHAIAVNNIIESRMTLSNKGIGYLFPLYFYLYDIETGEVAIKIENINPKFRKWIDDHYGEHFPPESILNHIYAVLHSPHYRARYAEFLRLDFPRIPFVKDIKEFHRLATVGGRLINAHLLTDVGKINVPLRGNDNLRVEKVKHDGDKLYINKDAYFSPISADVFAFQIGGYQPLDKYLKSRKGRSLSLHDVETVAKAAAAVTLTLHLMHKELTAVG